MKKIILNLQDRSYPIVITNSFSSLADYLKKLHPGDCACVITNPKIKRIFADEIISCFKSAGIEVHFLTAEDSEASKSFKTTGRLIEKILKIDKKNKKVFIAALGGGVVGDVAGFTASIYKRGVPFIQIPTTLLGQVDSAIGGKTAVDVKEAKNIIGAFYQPKLVYSNIAALKTLPLSEIRSGMAEIIKYAMIKDKGLFAFLENNMPCLLNREEKKLEKIICICAKIKAQIVSEDEKEKKGLRTILNFGHTFGHAIEAASAYSKKIGHGQAVAVGMLMACDLAVSLGICSKETSRRLEGLIKKAGLPVCMKNLRLKNIMSAMDYDKKFIHGKNRFVLPVDTGKVKVLEGLERKKILEAFANRLKND